ncbi:MAG: phage major capsid protein [Promethearchaeota archaeon]
MFKMAFTKLKEYISTADGSEGTLLIPKLIMPTLIEEVDKNLIPREMAAQVWGPGQIKGSSFTVNLIEPNTLDIRTIGEGAEIPLDAIDYETVTYEPVKYGVAIRITREMIEDSQFDLLQTNIRIAGKRFAENETNLILTALDGANSTVAGGAAITISNITEAIKNLHDEDYTPTDMIIGYEVLSDLQNIDTFVEADKAGNTEMMDRGFKGTIFNMNVAVFSTNAAPSSTYSKYAYVFDRSQAYGIAISRDISMENVTLPTFDMEGAVLTQRIDVELLRSKAVSKITTA